MKYAIETNALARVYQSYEKPEGILNSIKGFWTRNYKEKSALLPTTLQIPAGQIVGLVGANGAGKTTLLKILSGLIHPSEGDARVLGYRPWERSNEFLRRISILLGQKNQLWWDIPAMDSYDLLARIYDLDPAQAKKRVEELAELLQCTHVLRTQLRRLSLGERMKMEIIGSLLHSPDVLFLDEPTIGLDVVAQSTIRDFLMRYSKERKPTVILTSHYMDDIAKLADRLLLISTGKIVYDGTVNGFIAKSVIPQNISFSFSETLKTPLRLSKELMLDAGKEFYELKLNAEDVPAAITKITSAQTVRELKIEEADFEEVIRKFLEKEPRVF